MSNAEGELLRYVDPVQARERVSSFSPEESAVLETVNQKVAARESLEEVIDFLFDSTRNLSPCDRIGLALLQDGGGRIVSHYTKAAYGPLLLPKGYAEDLHGSSLRTVLERKAPRIISDLERYLALRPESNSTRLLVREGVRSNMTCPLLVEGRVVGVLFRSSRQPDAFDDRQVMLHQAVAERLSQAVEKTLRIEQLAAANRDYFGTLAFVTHELKSPISSIMMDAGLLRDGFLGVLQPKQQERVEQMLSKGRYLLGLIQDYLDLARIEGGDLKADVRDVDVIFDVIEPAVDLVLPQIEGRGMRLVRQLPDPPAAAQLDPDLLKIVLVNLLSNAAKYGSEGGEIRLHLAAEPDRLMIAVWNQGPGFAESEQWRLFRKFSRLQSPELLKQKGTGIGLYSSWRIVHAHGGKIRPASLPGQWAEFVVEIPQPPAPPAAFDLREST